MDLHLVLLWVFFTASVSIRPALSQGEGRANTFIKTIKQRQNRKATVATDNFTEHLHGTTK